MDMLPPVDVEGGEAQPQPFRTVAPLVAASCPRVATVAARRRSRLAVAPLDPGSSAVTMATMATTRMLPEAGVVLEAGGVRASQALAVEVDTQAVRRSAIGQTMAALGEVALSTRERTRSMRLAAAMRRRRARVPMATC